MFEHMIKFDENMQVLLTFSRNRRQQTAVRKASLDSTVSTEASDVPRIRTFDAVHITLNLETGSMLPLALR